MNQEIRKVIRQVLYAISVVLLLVAIGICIDVQIPDTPGPIDPKPNMEADLKPIKETIAWTFFISAGVLFLLARCLGGRKTKVN
jgi:hypothetical protein